MSCIFVVVSLYLLAGEPTEVLQVLSDLPPHLAPSLSSPCPPSSGGLPATGVVSFSQLSSLQQSELALESRPPPLPDLSPNHGAGVLSEQENAKANTLQGQSRAPSKLPVSSDSDVSVGQYVEGIQPQPALAQQEHTSPSFPKQTPQQRRQASGDVVLAGHRQPEQSVTLNASGHGLSERPFSLSERHSSHPAPKSRLAYERPERNQRTPTREKRENKRERCPWV